ncbi:hypothetical protein LSAT2_030082 [Lamellibrachia satsuma]|nr:hypothetical protein LSAT2_030082 [Lamellibrachia satsuma]
MVWQTELCDNIDRLRSNSELCDTTVIGSDGQTVFAHSALLAASSQTLKTQLVEHLHEGAPLTVYVDGISGYIWNFVLQFIYSGKIQPTNILEAESILQAGEALDIEALTDIGHKFMNDYMLELDYCGHPSNQSNQSNQSNVAVVHSKDHCMGFFVLAEKESMNEVNSISPYCTAKTVSTQTCSKNRRRVKRTKKSCFARRRRLSRRLGSQGRLGLSTESSTHTLFIHHSATQTHVSSAGDVSNLHHKPEGVWVCKICGVTFTEYPLLGPHMTTHAIEASWDSPDHVAFIPGVPVVDSPVVMGRLDENYAETYIDGECPQCRRIQKRSVPLPRHLYVCPLCGQGYRKRRLLRQYRMRVHGKELDGAHH